MDEIASPEADKKNGLALINTETCGVYFMS